MADQLPLDAGDAKQVQALKRLEQLGAQGNDAAWRDMGSTESGRRVLYLIAAECGWRGSIWDASSSRQTDFNAGLQQAGINVMGRFARLAPEQFMLALTEANQRDAEAELLRSAALTPTTEEQNDEDDNG